jgi:hypothetical protein
VARDQRVLKFFIRLMLPVFALAGFGSVASLTLPYMSWEKQVAVLESPTHRYRVEVIRVESPSVCGGARSLIVRVEHHISIFKMGEDVPFCLAGQGSIVLKWTAPYTLQIACAGCDDYRATTENWGKLHYQFDLERSGPDRP